MKKTLLLTTFFLLSFSVNSFSQEYHRLLNNTSWIIADMVSCCRPSVSKVIHEGTEEVIGNYTYTKFNDPFPQYENNTIVYSVYLREDVAAKKVYKIVNGVDTLLYDFNLETGDVISQYSYTFTATVDYVMVNDGTRKRITLWSTEELCGSNLRMEWIEGVGSNKHPFYPQHNMENVCSAGGGVMIFTKCCFQNGRHIAGDDDCSEEMETLMVNDTAALSAQLTVSPNPFNTELYIQSEIAFTDATIQIYNVVGQLVRESKNQSGNKLKVNRDNLESGLYFIQLSENGKVVKTIKIIAN